MDNLPQKIEAKKSISWQELKEAASLAYKSGLLPKNIDTVEKAIVIAMMGRELDLPPMASLTGIYVVNGMPALKAGLMLRLIYERVPGARITILTPTEQADNECVVEMQRPNGIAQKFRFSLEDAKKAGFLNKQVWLQNTSTMLRWAAIRTGARIVFPDAIAGIYMEDELPQAAALQGSSTAANFPMPTVVEAPVIEEPKLELQEAKPLLGAYIVPMGKKYKGQRLKDIPPSDIKSFSDWLFKQAQEKGEPLNGPAAEFYDNAMLYLDSLRDKSSSENFKHTPEECFEEKFPFEKGI